MTCSKCARCHRFEKLQLKTRTFEGDRRGMAVPATLRASGLEDRLGLRIQRLPLRRLAADCGKTLDAELLPGRLDSLDPCLEPAALESLLLCQRLSLRDDLALRVLHELGCRQAAYGLLLPPFEHL